MKSRFMFAVMVMACGGMIAQDAQAGLLAYEGFDYSVGTITTSGTLNGGSGWSGGWQIVDNAYGAGAIVSGNLTPSGSSLITNGNSISVGYNNGNGARFGRFLDTSATGVFADYLDSNGYIGKDGTTLYMSFVMKSAVSRFYELEFKKGDLGDGGRIGGIGEDVGNNAVNLRASGTMTEIIAGDTNSNLYVVKFDFLASDNDTVSIFANSTLGGEPATPTLLKTECGDMSLNGLSIAEYFSSGNINIDEIRLGTSYSSVTPIPEPGTIALLVTGIISLVAYAWRKRK